jgi:hypothetical protein
MTKMSSKVPDMPRKAGGWLGESRKRWAAWHTTGRAARLDAVGLLTLEQLVARADEAARAESTSLRLKLSKEARLLEASLLREFGDAPSTPAEQAQDRRQRATEARERFQDRMAHVLSFVGTLAEVARLELAALTDAGRPAGDALSEAEDLWWREHVLPRREALKAEREEAT